MPSYFLRTLDAPAVEHLYAAHMQTDFPAEERPPVAALVQQVRSGFLTAQAMTDGKEDFAYALAIPYEDYVLYTHLAVFPEHRGGGFGSRLMELLHQAYASSRVHLVEVENPAVAEDAQARHLQQRRIAFYQRAGYQLVPRIRYILYGVDMLLMTHTQEGLESPPPEEVAELLRSLYFSVLREKDRHHLVLTVTA